MAFLWHKYYDFAKFLYESGGNLFDEETVRRTSVSRAYYAAFCHARAYAQNNLDFHITKHPEDHRDLIECYLSRSFFKIANSLDRLRQWRNSCDYDEECQVSAQLVSSALKSADIVIKKL